MSERDISNLDPELPLALLPVRIEARYLPRGAPTHLCVRVFPDVIHADAHHTALTTREREVGRQFWTSIWGVTDAVVIANARAWLASQSTPYRALWIATATTPANLDRPTDSGPAFGEVAVDDAPGPVIASLLPSEWMVRLYDADLNLVHTEYSATIPADLPMAPTMSAAGTDVRHPTTGAELPAPFGFLAGQDLLWTVDFDQAVAIGMGVRIPIASVPDAVGALLVLGVRPDMDPIDEADAVDQLLTAHWYSRGLDVVRQGTPTNNSDAGRSGVSLSFPDLAELFEREASERPLAPLGRAALLSADPALLYRLVAADSLSLAFGRVRRNVLDRVANAEWGDGAASWAMNTATGYATMAEYINDPFAADDGTTFIGDDAPTLRDWYADWARGGAVLPVLRCGEQPYGVLPITHRTARHASSADFDFAYESNVTALRRLWERAFPIPALDPDATDSRPSGTETGDATIIAEVLGGVPHPTDLHLRAATDNLPADTEFFIGLGDQLETNAYGDNLLDPAHDSDVLAAWLDRKKPIFGLPDEHPPVQPLALAAQLRQVDLLADEIQQAMDRAGYVTTAAQAMLDIIDDQLRPLLQVYLEAVGEVPDPFATWATRGGMGRGDIVKLIGTTYDEGAAPVIDLVTTDGDVAEIRAFLEEVDAALEIASRDGVPAGQRGALIDGPAPLLHHLLQANYEAVPLGDIGTLRAALAVLLAMIDSPLVTDAVDQLERLMRESLGLALYRLDAWTTAIAAKRLAERRQKSPAGLQIGGFGWLLDLVPSDDPVSQGFIHTPSMNHAATAAVLRSGWSAYGTEDRESPLSVDLSSRRVRGAQWVLDAVRNGQDLAGQLGARFERFLHDAFVDEWIETVRLLALEARGDSRPPASTVDGLLVARSGANVDLSTQETSFRDSLLAATAPVAEPVEDAKRIAVRDAWQRVTDDLDAVADLTMAQAVHSLTQGNDDAASAVLAVTGGGDGSVPRIDVAGTQRAAQLITYRLIAMWDATDTVPAQDRPLAAAEPRLSGWVRSVLPAPAQILAGYQVLGADGTIRAAGELTIADLGLSVWEAALLASTAATQERSRLGRAVAAHVTSYVTSTLASGIEDVNVVVDLGLPVSVDGAANVDEFGLVAASLTQSLRRARPLRAADLLATAPADGLDSAAIDVPELEARVGATESAIAALITTLDGDGPARETALLRCAAIDVPGAITALEAGATPDAVTPVRDALAARLAPAGDEPTDPADAARQRLQSLTGGVIPILPTFTPVGDPERAASAGSDLRRGQIAADGYTWLSQCARVRSDVGAAYETVLLAEAIGGQPIGRFGLAQVPDRGGPWAAVHQPSGDDDTLSIVALTGADVLVRDGTPVAGLFIDGWTEGIPRRKIQTGIAVHFDAPSARPPQTILLSVVDDERGFSADDLSDQLLNVIGLAKLRAIGPADIPDIGQFLPGVFLPANTEVSGSRA